MKIDSVFLVIPPYIEEDHSIIPLIESPLITEALGLESIAATLEGAGYRVELLHCQLENISLDQAVKAIMQSN
jgi:hypothetical protein